MPLHAAGMYEGPDTACCSDYVVSSYTPTLAVLLRAQVQKSPQVMDQLQVLPVSPKHRKHRRLPILYGVGDEVQQACRVARQYHIATTKGSESGLSTVENVIKSMSGANIVHFACQQSAASQHAHENAFILSDGQLPISRLMDLDLGSGKLLAYLSEGQPGEAVRFAGDVMYAGFKNVIATMG